MAKKKNIIPFERYKPDWQQGLDKSQVEARLSQGRLNYDKSKASKSYTKIILKNVFTLFNLLWLFLGTVLISIGQIGDCFFLIIIFANLSIGIFQEIKAKRMVEKLSLISTPTALVIRDGEKSEMPTTKIVLDDIVEYETGKQIAADGIVKNGKITVNESMLTGESVPVKKAVGDKIYAGSFVVSGRCQSTADCVGMDNYVSQLATRAKKLKHNSSPILITLNRIIKLVAILIIPVAILVCSTNYISTRDWVETIRNSAAAIIGMVPAGMFLLTSVALFVGVIKLSTKKTLVQDLYSIEMLARCNVLCLDKTGTITDGTMKVNNFIVLDEDEQDASKKLSSVLYATEDNNSTANALVRKFGATDAYHATKSLPFNSATKISGATLEEEGTFIIGAAEFVLKKVDVQVTRQIQEYSLEGKRVLLVAHSQKPIVDDVPPDDLKPYAIIVIEDRIRKEAVDTIKWFKENSVEVKIISGDNPMTVSHIAKRVGVENAEKYISLDGLSDDEVIKSAKEYTVFGRVSPEQKALLVQAMKKNGKTVGMTGDGVNDILAFKEADCSIAMATGSDAAKNIASLVLMDSNFSNMPTVVAEGRRVANNIQQSSSMYLMKTLFVFFMIIISFGKYPFNTRNMLILELFIIGIPTFFLALQPNKNIISGSFFLSIMRNALPFALSMLGGVIVMTVLGNIGHITAEQQKVMSVMSLTFTGLVMLIIACTPFNLYRSIMVSVMAACAVCGVIFFKDYLQLDVHLDLWMELVVALCVSLSMPVGLLLKYLAGCLNLNKYDDIL